MTNYKRLKNWLDNNNVHFQENKEAYLIDNNTIIQPNYIVYIQQRQIYIYLCEREMIEHQNNVFKKFGQAYGVLVVIPDDIVISLTNTYTFNHMVEHLKVNA